jgi:DNA-binding beta-propeller fold protein YncE
MEVSRGIADDRRKAATLVIVGLIVTALPLTQPAAASGSTSTAPSSLVVQQRWKLAGGGGWDYLTLDSAGKRLFISRDDHVEVLDTASGKVSGTVPGTNGVHGIALAEDLNRGFTSNGHGDSVTAFDLATLKVINEAPVSGHGPDAILYEPTLKHIFTFNGRSKNVSVLDAASLSVVATLPAPDKPEFAVDDAAGHIFVNIESDAGQILVIDSRKLTVTATWAIPGCATPSGLAIDRTHHRLFSVCDARVMAITDAESGKQVGRVKIGNEPDAAEFDAKRELVFSSNGDGTLTVIHQDSADHYTMSEILETQSGARTMALDRANGKIYLVAAKFGPPPAATPEHPHPYPRIIPDSVTVLVVAPK